jgi:pimeloyl-ACP methyl ester carboxylesterase
MNLITHEAPSGMGFNAFGEKVFTERVRDIVFVPGLCGSEYDWGHVSDKLNTNLLLFTSFLKKPNGCRTIGDYSGYIKKFMDSSRNYPVFVAHSAGCLALAGAIENNFSKVGGVIFINPSPCRGISLPLSSLRRNLRLQYIWPLITGKNVVPVSKDVKFLTGGANVTFTPDSPWVSAQLGGPFGFKVPRLCNLSCKSLIIQSNDDETIGRVARNKIRAYHNVRTEIVSGGHYPHCHPDTQDAVAEIIRNKLKEWGVM